MSEYRIEFRPVAIRHFEALPERAKVKVAQVVEALTEDPFDPGTKALQGPLPPFRRARAGDWCVLYHVDREARLVTIAVLGLRSDIYKLAARMSN